PAFRPTAVREEMPASNAPSARDPPLQRKMDPSVPSAVRSVPAGAPPAAATQSPGAVAAEIRLTPSPADAARIVWRKANTDGENQESVALAPAATLAPTHTGGFQIMRQADSEAGTNADVAPAALPAPESSGADVGLIAEQVSRIIARQLRVERERRGRR